MLILESSWLADGEGGFLQPIFFKWVLDLVVSSEWLLRSSKPCLARMFADVPFLYCLFNAIFKLRQAVDDRRKKTTDLIFYVLFFLEVVLCLIVHLLY